MSRYRNVPHAQRPTSVAALLDNLRKNSGASMEPHYMTRRWAKDNRGIPVSRYFNQEFHLGVDPDLLRRLHIMECDRRHWRLIEIKKEYLATFYVLTLQKKNVDGNLVKISVFPWELGNTPRECPSTSVRHAPMNIAYKMTKNPESAFIELKRSEYSFEPDCIWFERLKIKLVDFIPDKNGLVEFEYGRAAATAAINHAMEFLNSIKNITNTPLILDQRLNFNTEAYMCFRHRRRNTEDIIPLHDNDPWDEKEEAQQSAKELCRRQKELDIVRRLQKIEEEKAKQIQEKREEREKHLVTETVRSQRSHTPRIEGEYRKPTRQTYKNALRFVNATRRAGQDDKTVAKEAQNLAEVHQWFADQKQIKADEKLAEDLRKADVDDKFDKDTEAAIERSKSPESDDGIVSYSNSYSTGAVNTRWESQNPHSQQSPTTSTLTVKEDGKWVEKECPEDDFPGNYYADTDANGNDGIMFHGQFIPTTKPNNEGASTSSGDFGTWLENARSERQREDVVKELKNHKEQLLAVLEELMTQVSVTVAKIDKGKGRATFVPPPPPTPEYSDDEYEIINEKDCEPNGEASGENLGKFAEEDQVNIALAKSAKEAKEA